MLVLDDYHMITDGAVHESVGLLLERLPPHVHVVVAARGVPPLPLGRLRVAGELLELRTDDLAFRDDEVAQLLATIPGLTTPTPTPGGWRGASRAGLRACRWLRRR